MCCHLFQDVNLDIQCYQCLYIDGILCTQLTLQFYSVLFEKLYVDKSWPGNVDELWIQFSRKGLFVLVFLCFLCVSLRRFYLVKFNLLIS